MKNSTSILFLFFGLFLTLSQFSCTNSNEETYAFLDDLLDSRRIMLPNGWSLSVPGESIPLGDFPLNLVTSKDGQVMAVTNNGQSEQSIMLIDPQTFEIIHKTEIPKSWYGLTFNLDLGNLGALAGGAGLVVSLIVAWSPAGQGSGLYVGLRLPGSGGGKIIGGWVSSASPTGNVWGRVVQSNFDDYPMMRLKEMPEVTVIAIDSEDEIGGIGEPGYPPLGPAVLNALFDATGKRVRRLPLKGNLGT